MKSIKWKFLISLLGFLLGMPCLLNANVLPNLSLEEKSANSDLVVIGVITRSPPKNNSKHFVVRIEIVLKGSSKLKTVEFNPSSYIVERQTSCCLIERRYLFFW
jgi:hypothetical protein